MDATIDPFYCFVIRIDVLYVQGWRRTMVRSEVFAHTFSETQGSSSSKSRLFHEPNVENKICEHETLSDYHVSPHRCLVQLPHTTSVSH